MVYSQKVVKGLPIEAGTNRFDIPLPYPFSAILLFSTHHHDIGHPMSNFHEFLYFLLSTIFIFNLLKPYYISYYFLPS